MWLPRPCVPSLHVCGMGTIGAQIMCIRAGRAKGGKRGRGEGRGISFQIGQKRVETRTKPHKVFASIRITVFGWSLTRLSSVVHGREAMMGHGMTQIRHQYHCMAAQTYVSLLQCVRVRFARPPNSLLSASSSLPSLCWKLWRLCACCAAVCSALSATSTEQSTRRHVPLYRAVFVK